MGVYRVTGGSDVPYGRSGEEDLVVWTGKEALLVWVTYVFHVPEHPLLHANLYKRS